MNETLRDRLFKLTRDPHIHQVDLVFKCKTKDGMLYTLDILECRKTDCPESILFAEFLESHAIKGVLDRMGLVQDARGDKFYFSAHESVAICKDEIIRVWADIDCAHYDDGAQII
jgi:hypothetical protein